MEENKEKVFEGATISGKEFPFVRLTINSTAKLLKKLKPSICSVFVNAMSPNKEQKRWWIKVRSVAFVKTGLWKYFGIIPKELRCSVILQKEAEAAEESFFVYAPEIVQRLSRQLNSVKSSQTENNKPKSED
jgi:hypothetical protein